MGDTDRVTVLNGARISGIDAARKWAKTCPLNDIIKRQAVDEWLSDLV